MKLDVIMEGDQFIVSGFGKNETLRTTIYIITPTNNFESPLQIIVWRAILCSSHKLIS